MSAATETDQRPEQLDEVLVILQRIHPGEMEAAELEEETGLDSGSLRECIRWMEEHNELDASADFYRWNDPTEPAPAKPTSSSSAADAPEDEEPEAADREEAPADIGPGAHVQAGLLVTATFARGVGESDKGAARKVQAICEEVQAALETALPKLNTTVKVESVDAYDSRRIWPPED